jgi:hypothetical protein
LKWNSLGKPLDRDCAQGPFTPAEDDAIRAGKAAGLGWLAIGNGINRGYNAVYYRYNKSLR